MNYKTLKGIPAAPGISIGKAFLYKKEIEIIDNDFNDNKNEALINLENALKKSKKELKKIFTLAVDKLGDKRAAIFEAQIMILDDPVLMGKIKSRIINENNSPSFIVHSEFSKYQKILSEAKESYLNERSYDIEDIKNRIIRNLKQKKWKSRIDSEVIVVTNNITPADTVLFSRVNVKGYITNFGGLTSHAAIVARSLKIPAVLGIHEATDQIKDGDFIIIDGFQGIVIISPNETQLSLYKNKIKKLEDLDSELAKLSDKPAVTLDNKKIILSANLDIFEELDFIIQNGAEGIGLVRTEQIFPLNEEFPSEDKQYKTYLNLAENLYPNNVVIRVFDIGGDKVLPHDVKEPNPFLGWRGIRFLLDNHSLFKTQMRALLRASIHKNVKIMIPMVSSIDEITKSKEILENCKFELQKEAKEFDNNIEFGIMIEVPSAAILINELASKVNFVSIGTNDLIQYLLAVDRGNEIVSNLYQELHPAVLRILNEIVKGCKHNNTKVSICGEMAADILAIPLLIGIGITHLSVSPAAIPQIKKTIRSFNYKDAKKLASECLKLNTEKDISEKTQLFFKQHFVNDIKSAI